MGRRRRRASMYKRAPRNCHMCGRMAVYKIVSALWCLRVPTYIKVGTFHRECSRASEDTKLERNDRSWRWTRVDIQAFRVFFSASAASTPEALLQRRYQIPPLKTAQLLCTTKDIRNVAALRPPSVSHNEKSAETRTTIAIRTTDWPKKTPCSCGLSAS